MGKTYYYIDSNVIEDYDNYLQRKVRNSVVLMYDDYPTHKHNSYKQVKVHQLFTLKEIKRIRSLESNIGRFSKIELEKEEIFYNSDRERYEKAFEKKNNTLVWLQNREKVEKC